MPTTPLNGFRYPALSDNPNGPLALSNLASDVDTKMPRGMLCKPVALSGNTGTAGGYLSVGTSPTLTIPAGRSIQVRANAQLYFVGAAGQELRMSLERWSAGVLQVAFGARAYDITGTPRLIAVTLDDVDQPPAGSYQYKVAASITGGATSSYVNNVPVPTGRAVGSALLISDVGPVPAI